ncbi:MAG: hypothetical protein H6581_28025 [Bacteroidia bacterium]|nr:hypothetical protein [Bacteroidia bacterium]
MSQVVNVLIVVDADNLVSKLEDGTIKKGTQSSPTNLGSYGTSDNFIYMVAKNGVAANNQAKSELTIDVRSGDTIVWNMTTFGNMSTTSAFLYNSDFNLTSGQPPIAIPGVTYANQVIGVRLPSTNNPTGQLGQYVNHQYVASSQVNNIAQTIQYSMSFELVDEASGDILGYFRWDPFIVIPF